MFKWNIQTEAIAKATTKDIWIDVPSWPAWGIMISNGTLLMGPFKTATEAKLKTKDWFISKFCLLSI